MIKLWTYPTANAPIHDNIPVYVGTVPFCARGIAEHVQWVEQHEADYFFCGQIPDFALNPFPVADVFKHFADCPEKHIVDLEGDYRAGTFREEFAGCVRIASGPPPHWRRQMVCPRPTFSTLLIHAKRNPREWSPPATNHFAFIGKPDSAAVRMRMARACVMADVPRDVRFTDSWNGPSAMGGAAHQLLAGMMLHNAIALCPQGEGVNTARFYEACYFGRFPVIIGKQMLPGEHYHDTSFAIQLDSQASDTSLAEELAKIAAMPFSEVIERGKAAHNYWQQVMLPYFKDPTRFFLDWLIQ